MTQYEFVFHDVCTVMFYLCKYVVQCKVYYQDNRDNEQHGITIKYLLKTKMILFHFTSNKTLRHSLLYEILQQ